MTDDLKKARQARNVKIAQQATMHESDLALEVWVHNDGSTTRRVIGSDAFAMKDFESEQRVIDTLLGSVADVAQDFAGEETYEDSWKNGLVTFVWFNRGGARYLVSNEFLDVECTDWRGRIRAAGFMLARAFIMFTWGVRCMALCFTYRPKTNSAP